MEEQIKTTITKQLEDLGSFSPDETFEAKCDAFCWFAEDYPNFREILINSLCDFLILKSQSNDEINGNIRSIFFLLDRLFHLREAGQVLIQSFSNQFFDVLKATLKCMDNNLISQMEEQVNLWQQQNFFPDEKIFPILNLISEYKSTSSTNQSFEPIKKETTRKQRIPGIDYFEIEITLGGFEDSSSDQIERNWMRPVEEWEQNPVADKELQRTKGIEFIPKKQIVKYLKITPENESSKCGYCNGPLKKGPYNDFMVFKEVEFNQDSDQIYHSQCYNNLQNQNKNQGINKLLYS